MKEEVHEQVQERVRRGSTPEPGEVLPGSAPVKRHAVRPAVPAAPRLAVTKKKVHPPREEMKKPPKPAEVKTEEVVRIKAPPPASIVTCIPGLDPARPELVPAAAARPPAQHAAK